MPASTARAGQHATAKARRRSILAAKTEIMAARSLCPNSRGIDCADEMVKEVQTVA